MDPVVSASEDSRSPGSARYAHVTYTKHHEPSATELGAESHGADWDELYKLLRQFYEPKKQSAEEKKEAQWEVLHKAMEKYDEGMLARWTGTMNYLLIFAGLFSAVVTAFIIESYQWLQEDPADVTVAILRNISMQMSTSPVSISSALVNSTSQLDGSSNSSFKPSALQVTVNVLWFLSLAISLVAALLAILVLQWLQEYPLRGHVSSGRAGVRMRQLRYNALQTWGVPDIVALLPVLLQIALLLFATGLLNLLWSINQIVALVVTVFLAIPAAFVVATSLLPLRWPTCSYKSPLSTIVYTTWHGANLIITHVLLFVFSLIGVVMFLLAIAAELALVLAASLRIRPSLWKNSLAIKVAGRYIIPMKAYLMVMTQNSHHRLSSRRQLPVRDMKKAEKVEMLDRSALSWGQHALPSHSLLELEICLEDLKEAERAKCILEWAKFALHISNWRPRGGSFALDRIFERCGTFEGIDPVVVERLRRLLLTKAIYPGATVFTEQQTQLPREIRSILLVLRQLIRIQNPPPTSTDMTQYISMLMSSLSSMGRASLPNGPRILARCLFEYWYHLDPAISAQCADMKTVDQITVSVLECKAVGTPDIGCSRHETSLRADALLCFTAAILLQHVRNPPSGGGRSNCLATKDDVHRASLGVAPEAQEASPNLGKIIRKLAEFVHAERGRTMLLSDTNFGSSDAAQRVALPVWPSLCDSLLQLAQRDSAGLPFNDMQMLVRDLRYAFQGKINPRLAGVDESLEQLAVFYPPDDGRIANIRLELGRMIRVVTFLAPLSLNDQPSSLKARLGSLWKEVRELWPQVAPHRHEPRDGGDDIEMAYSRESPAVTPVNEKSPL